MSEPRRGKFIITEIIEVGSGANRRPIRFEWDNAHRNSPFQPWTFGVQLRTVRTDYPGADDPTEQVLGPNFTPFTLRGRWSDKFNPINPVNPQQQPGPGYAIRTWKEFELLVRSGNRVRMQFQDIVIEGLITAASFDVRRNDDIRYDFTFSPHHRQPGGQFALKRSPRTVLNARQLRDEAILPRDNAQDVHSRAPRLYTTGVLHAAVQNRLDEWDANLVSITDVTDQRVILPQLEPSDALLKLAALFLRLQESALDIIELLRATKTDVNLFFEAVPQILDFDAWAKGLQFEARNMIVTANQAARDISERAEPNSMALYRPEKNESLYGVSNRFYGTPHNWRRIVTRNNLGDDFVLTGEELLIIPEAPAR